MIGVIDYGLGNVQAFLNVYKRLNIAAFSVSRPEQLITVTKVILPGVGAFDHAMERLDESGLRDALSERVLRAGVPVLGVCVGMQMLARSSEEGSHAGLGWIHGDVKRFTAPVPLPHMGWNDVKSIVSSPLLAGLESDARFYFLHSYYFDCDRADNALALAEYGAAFSCIVGAGNIYGVQFHPEKSHHYGTRLLQNFAEL
jgi:imidazole glycerol-phosphate synthase subunit HisH